MHIKTQAKWFLALTLLPVLAQAGTSVGFQTIYQSFKTVTQGWYAALFVDALGLFTALFTIEIVWMVVKWLITGKDVHEIFTSFVKKLLSIGFFFSILMYSNQLFPDLIDAFKTAAVGAGGPPITTVSDITMTALRAFLVCIEAGPISATTGVGTAASDIWNLNFSGAASALGDAASAAITTVLGVNVLVGILVGLILLVSFIYLVLELFAVQLEAMLVMGAGVIMLGFGGSSLTVRFSESYMQYALSVGVRLLILTLWAGFVEWQVAPLIKTILTQGGAGLEAYGIVLILALLVGWLTKKLQGIASSILSGTSSMSGGELASTIMKGAALATAAIATGGVAAAGLAGGAAAGGLSGATGAAGSAGAGSLGAAGGSATPMASGVAGANPAGIAAPSGGATQGTSGGASSGVQAPVVTSGGSIRTGANRAEASQSGSTTPAPTLNTAEQPARAGGDPGDASGGKSSAVDHRASAPNESSQGSSGGSGKGQSAPDPVNQKLDKPIQSNAPKDPSFMDRAKQHEDVLNKTHDALLPGKASTVGVSAPSIGAKHLSD